jgi:hypothetical protein
VNYCYSAYPMVREMRQMVRTGQIGKVRLVVTNFSHGHHGDATDADNPRVRWRYDPAMAGVSGQFADCGIHALHMASFIVGDEVDGLGRLRLDDPEPRAGGRRDGELPHEGGTVGRLWTSSVAIGRQHGFDIQVFGETGGLRWASEQPNQVFYTPVGGRTQIMEKGEAGLSRRGGAALAAWPSRIPRAFRWRWPTSTSTSPPRSGAKCARRLAHGGGRAALDGGGLRQRRLGEGRWRLDRRAAADVPLRLRRGQGAQRAPLDHPAGEKPRLGVAVGVLDRGHDEVDRGVDDLGNGLADRGQVDVLPARHLHVVEPDQPDIARARTGPRPAPR